MSPAEGPLNGLDFRVTTMDVTPDSIAILVLAAGGSSRMGRPKQLLMLDGSSLLRRAAGAAVAVGGSVVVVLGRDPDAMRPELAGLPVTIVENADWSVGMGSSIRTGMAAVDPNVRAVVVTLCDQPYVDAEVIRRLIAAFDAGGRPMAAAGYAGTVGVPAVFGRAAFDRLRTLDPAAGAKAVLSGPDVTVVDLPAAAVDVDTPDDYRRLGGIAERPS